MLLVLDMGNTNITVGVFDGDRLVVESRLATDYRKMGDEYAMDLMDILSLYHLQREDIDGAIISSVVPSLDRALQGAIQKVSGVLPLQVGPGVKSGMDIPIEERDENEVLCAWGKLQNGKKTSAGSACVRVANPTSHALNPGFDVTPPELITGFITPKGIFKPKELAAKLAQNRR